MPFRYYPPGADIFALIVAGILKMFGKPKRRSGKADQHYEPYVSEVQRMLDAHADCTAELFNIFISGSRKVAPFSRLAPGDRMEARLNGDSISFLVDEVIVADAELPESSLLPRVFNDRIEPEAFLGGRDVANASEEAEFATVVVFYKIEGVPPTKIQIE